MLGNTTLVPFRTTAVWGENCLSFCLISSVWPRPDEPFAMSTYTYASLSAPLRVSTRPVTVPRRSPLLLPPLLLLATAVPPVAPGAGVAVVPVGGMTGGGKAADGGTCPPD